MNGGGARCGVAGGEGARRFVRGALRIDAQLGGGEGKRRGKGKRRPGSAAGRGQEREAGGWRLKATLTGGSHLSARGRERRGRGTGGPFVGRKRALGRGWNRKEGLRWAAGKEGGWAGPRGGFGLVFFSFLFFLFQHTTTKKTNKNKATHIHLFYLIYKNKQLIFLF
jgi:hypothetical protein